MLPIAFDGICYLASGNGNHVTYRKPGKADQYKIIIILAPCHLDPGYGVFFRGRVRYNRYSGGLLHLDRVVFLG